MKRLFVALALVTGCGDGEKNLEPQDCRASTYTMDCTDFKGNLVISKTSNYDNLRTIEGDLIVNNTSHRIVSFQNLESIGRNLEINNNAELTEFRATKLANIGSQLSFESNPKLIAHPDWSRVEIVDGLMPPEGSVERYMPEGPQSAVFTASVLMAYRCAMHPGCRRVAYIAGKWVATGTGMAGTKALEHLGTEWVERNLCDGSCYEYLFGD